METLTGVLQWLDIWEESHSTEATTVTILYGTDCGRAAHKDLSGPWPHLWELDLYNKTISMTKLTTSAQLMLEEPIWEQQGLAGIPGPADQSP